MTATCKVPWHLVNYRYLVPSTRYQVPGTGTGRLPGTSPGSLMLKIVIILCVDGCLPISSTKNGKTVAINWTKPFEHPIEFYISVLPDQRSKFHQARNAIMISIDFIWSNTVMCIWLIPGMLGNLLIELKHLCQSVAKLGNVGPLQCLSTFYVLIKLQKWTWPSLSKLVL